MAILTDTTFHSFQKFDDKNCGLVCLEMIYKLRKMKRNVSEILKAFDFIEDGMSTYAPQLARDLNAQNLKTYIYAMNTRIMPPSWQGLESQDLINNLKKWVVHHKEHDWFMHNLHLLFYLQEGGSIELKMYTLEDMKRMLDSGSIILICLDEVWLHDHRKVEKKTEYNNITGDTHGHYVLVVGYNQDMLQIADPYPNNSISQKGLYMVSAEKILAGSYSWAGSIVEIR
ncbi:hypothetical protein KBD81_02965 [Candidatus Woesebacteria bacterium]|nr:hypothetical protein [Candidatus Woesebacteria bacterium]